MNRHRKTHASTPLPRDNTRGLNDSTSGSNSLHLTNPGRSTRNTAASAIHIGPALRILQLNVEGLSWAKRQLIKSIAEEHNVDIVCLQETHVDRNENQLLSIDGYDLVSVQLHLKHGRAAYVRSDIIDVKVGESSEFCDIFSVGAFNIANVYKPPSREWETSVLQVLRSPGVYCGDFNSHHTEWGYETANSDGERRVEWASNNDIALVHDPKQSGTFHSARWNRDYNPDLCWVTSVNGVPQPASVQVLGSFPHSQHRPVLISLGLQIPLRTRYKVHRNRDGIFEKQTGQHLQLLLNVVYTSYLLRSYQLKKVTNVLEEPFGKRHKSPYHGAIENCSLLVLTRNVLH